MIGNMKIWQDLWVLLYFLHHGAQAFEWVKVPSFLICINVVQWMEKGGSIWMIQEIERRRTMMKKRVVVLCCLMGMLLSGCGTKQGKEDTVKEIPKQIETAKEYKVEWLDTSVMGEWNDIYASTDETHLYLLCKKLKSEDEEGKRNYQYREVSYDMVEQKWEVKELSALSKKINQIGNIYLAERDGEGNWYCYLAKWNKENKFYEDGRFAKIEGDIIDYENLPQDIFRDEIKQIRYEIEEDGKILFLIGNKQDYEDGIQPEDGYQTVFYDPLTETAEVDNMKLLWEDIEHVGDEYLYQSITPNSCGYKIKKRGSDNVIREILCEGKPSSGTWTSGILEKDMGESMDITDSDGNIYMLNNDGIYTGNIKEGILRQCVKAESLTELELQWHDMDVESMENEKDRYIYDFWLGADAERQDFYIPILEEYTSAASDRESVLHIAHLVCQE